MAENPVKSPVGTAHNNAIEDEFWVKQFGKGDDSAFDRIVEQHSADIAKLANRLLGWPCDVEDVVQDIFLAVFIGLKKFRWQCSLKTWLFTITINKCRTYRYKRMLHLRIFSRGSDKAPTCLANRADKMSMESETFNRIRRAVKALPVKYREPVVLRYLQELSVDTICQILGISENNLQIRLNRARKLLKEELAELIEE